MSIRTEFTFEEKSNQRQCVETEISRKYLRVLTDIYDNNSPKKYCKNMYSNILDLEQRCYTKVELMTRDKVKHRIVLKKRRYIIDGTRQIVDNMDDVEKSILFYENIIVETDKAYLIGDNRTCQGYNLYGKPCWNEWVQFWLPKNAVEPKSLEDANRYKLRWIKVKKSRSNNART